MNGPGTINGFGYSRWIREHKPGVRVILAGTLEKLAGDAGDLCEEGSIRYKPYHHQTLHDRIKQKIVRRDAAREHD